MKYVASLQIQESTVNVKPEKTIKEVQKEQVKTTTEPVKPVIQQSTDSSIYSKTHQLPTTKGYLLKEYAYVFKVIGTLPGWEYHIQLMDEYRPVQHPLQQVAVSLKPAYRTDLDRLLKLGITKKVEEYTK